jgi:hypothetical protein
MIIGGQSSKVELYNYVSREQCLLPDMPKSNYQGNAAWLNNTAVVCDGHWVTAVVQYLIRLQIFGLR